MTREELEALIGDAEEIDESTIFEKIKEKENIKTILNTEKDKTSNLRLENWKKENLDKIKEEYKKEYEKKASKTPEQIRLEELEEKVQRFELESSRKSLELIATRELQNNNLSSNFLDFVIGNDEDTTKEKIYKFRDAVKEEARKMLETESKGFIRKPDQSLSGRADTSGAKNYSGASGMAAYLQEQSKAKK